jgi:hypothetical protein
VNTPGRLARRILALAALAATLPNLELLQTSLLSAGLPLFGVDLVIGMQVVAAVTWLVWPEDRWAGLGLIPLPLLLRVHAPTIADGGDSVAVFLLAWLSAESLVARGKDPLADRLRRLFAAGGRWQVHVVYASACLAKLRTTEWRTGAGFEQYGADPYYGVLPQLDGVVRAVAVHDWLTVPICWGVIALEGALALCWLMSRHLRRFVLAAGVLMHIGIAVVLGLGSFALVMVAALVYLWPSAQPSIPDVVPAQRAPGLTPVEVTP